MAVYGGFHSKEKASLSLQEEKQEKFCLPGNFEISLGKEAGERNSVLLSLSNLLGPRGEIAKTATSQSQGLRGPRHSSHSHRRISSVMHEGCHRNRNGRPLELMKVSTNNTAR